MSQGRGAIVGLTALSGPQSWRLGRGAARDAVRQSAQSTGSSAFGALLRQLPRLMDAADKARIMYRIYVIDKVRKGQDAVNKGHRTTSEELRRETGQW